MIGPRVGIACGLRVGLAVGLAQDPVRLAGGLSGVSQDSTSLVYRPANSTEWTATMAAAGIASGNPGGLWLLQDASGNLADAIGANPLVVAGTPSYRQANVGWTTLSFNITATTVQTASLGAGVFNPAATSVAWLGYCCLTGTPGGNRTVLTLSNNASPIMVVHNAANKLLLTCAGNTVTSVNNYTTSTIFPLAVVYDLTHSTCTMYTGLEALTVTFSAIPDGSKGLGALVASSDSTAHWNLLTAFSGAAAELTTANMRALLTTLNWAPVF